MYWFSPDTLRKTIWLMLALLVFQGIVVVHEARVSLSEDVAVEDVFSNSFDDVLLSADSADHCDEGGDDFCDHCCQCHGHGSHIMALASGSMWSGDTSSVLPRSLDISFDPPVIHSIHRPPIA